jgi:hypothetical protein
MISECRGGRGAAAYQIAKFTGNSLLPVGGTHRYGNHDFEELNALLRFSERSFQKRRMDREKPLDVASWTGPQKASAARRRRFMPLSRRVEAAV